MRPTAVAAPEQDHDPRPIRMLVLEDAVRRALNELGVPDDGYPIPVANAVAILQEALDPAPDMRQ